MMLKHASYAVAMLLSAATAATALANDDADRAILERKMKTYAADILQTYPSQKPFFFNNKTPMGQGLVDEVYLAFKTAKGKDTSIGYNSYTPGDRVGDKDYPGIEQADAFFCGCPQADANAIKAAVVRQGFKGTFVALALPN